ncbi:flagellar hook-basal body complex protein FliE [Dermatobacter hominis]|uniref:flagellar hook-basal body complex protein FliE n=1 Tax=Dermatobacter hominis TaxID=2884263 RepID=UPI001D111E9D|nr:flagellar hook-basal body complex protein FliE [Dermatobacter hominis]UDY37178.1 flagellar hook-basal body complex protein FliE [Dermatobacter hominis]
MPITPISGVTAAFPTTATSPTSSASSAGSAEDFSKAITGALDDLDASQRNTDQLAKAAATGDLERVEDLMVATTETQLMTQLTVAVRNRAIESFNEVMRMQL